MTFSGVLILRQVFDRVGLAEFCLANLQHTAVELLRIAFSSVLSKFSGRSITKDTLFFVLVAAVRLRVHGKLSVPLDLTFWESRLGGGRLSLDFRDNLKRLPHVCDLFSEARRNHKGPYEGPEVKGARPCP